MTHATLRAYIASCSGMWSDGYLGMEPATGY